MRSLLIPALLFATSAAYAQDASDPANPETGAIDSDAVAQSTDAIAQTVPDVVFGGPEPLSVETAEGVHIFSVELAETPEQLARGLMYREALADDAGMLFRYNPPRATSMWMENTLIPLDIVFIDGAGEVVKVTAFAQPGSRRSLGSDFPIAGVLELAEGRAVELGIRPGSIVRHRFFANEDLVEESASETPAETEETATADAEDTE